jgi:hypothetical protein
MAKTWNFSPEQELKALRWSVALLALAVLSFGLRLIVWMQVSANSQAKVEARLQVAETWEVYWHQRVNEESATQKGKQ